MNNVYRVIWNSTLQLWVVTSELGRGKIKRAANRVLTALIISPLLAGPLLASTCYTNICELDNVWSFTTNNSGAGAVTISDGQVWTISGPTSYAYAEGSYRTYSTINQLINAGYINASPLPSDEIQVNVGSKSQNITVTDPITSSSTVVSVYDSDSFREFESGYSNGGFGVAATGSIDVYNQTRMLTVTSGYAEINAPGLTISGAHRDSQLVFVDSTVLNATAEATWTSENAISFKTEPNYANSLTQTAVARKTTYEGGFTAFDNSNVTVSNLNELQDYNNWLITKIQSGELAASSYDTELAKAYTTVNTSYWINRVPDGADPVLTQDAGIVTVFSANGDKALVRLTETGRITGDIRGPAVGTINAGVFRLTNGAKGINDGEIETTYYTATVLSGSTFINNGSLTTGTTNNGNPGRGVYISGTDSLFTNNGVLNISPEFWSSVSNNASLGVTVLQGGTAQNKGIINVGITEGNKGRAVLGGAYGVRIDSGGNYINSEDAEMYIGRNANGNDVYAASGSTAIRLNSGSAGTVNNKGSIVIGTMAEGSYGIYAASSGNYNVTNSGSIVIKGNGDNGQFVPKENVGIYAQNNAKGFQNTGGIDIQGINATGIKALNGGQIRLCPLIT